MLQDGDTTADIEFEDGSHATMDSTILYDVDKEKFRTGDGDPPVEILSTNLWDEHASHLALTIKKKWSKIVGPDTEIVVSTLLLPCTCIGGISSILN